MKLIRTLIFLVGLAVIIYTVIQFSSDLTERPLYVESEEVTTPSSETQTVHKIRVTDKGFEPEELTIKIGDKVVWENVREGRLKKLLILGSRQCIRIKSEALEPGETFEWTFNKAEKCIFVDAITKYQTAEIVIEE
jgi:plastocyanin